MMNQLRADAHALRKPVDSRFAILLALVLMLALAVGNGHAATLVWTNGNDFWQTTTAWATNGGSTGNSPGTNDTASLTNGLVGTTPAMYTVTLNANASVNQVLFNNGTTTMATITLDLGTNSLSAYKATSTQPTAFVMSDNTRATATVYIAAATGVGGLFVTNATSDTRVTIGRNGMATLIVTNGMFSANSTVLGNGSSSRGTLLLSGANTYWTNSSSLAVGNAAASCSNNLIISDSASLTVVGQFKVGFNTTSSTNALLLDTAGRLFTKTNGTSIGTAGSNNLATVRGGAVWDNGSTDFTVGGTGTNNVLAIGAGSAVININTAIVSAANTLDLQGGLLQASVVVSNFGTVRGFGSIAGDTIITSGSVLSPSNSLGQLTFSNSLTLASGATTTVQVGTNFNTTAVSSNLTLDGTLNVTDGGGFTNGTYALFTYGGSLTTNGSASILTIGTTPDTNLTYSVDIETNGQVNLVVASVPAASFTADLTSGAAPLAVTFTDGSVGTITNRYWDLGDGTTTNTTATNLAHTYNAGTFTVSLIISAYGGTSTNTRSNYIVVTNPPPPVADFTGSPTNGSAPLVVTFTDGSTGTITNRFWDFGDGATSNTTLTSLTHTYTNVATLDVGLTVFGPGGTDTLSRTGYITITNALPVITTGLTVTNALLQVGNVAVVVAGDTNVFNVGATDPNGNPLGYQWTFGDGVTNDWSSSSTAEHAYNTNCGPYNVSVTVSNGLVSVSSNFTVTVACQLDITKLQLKVNFAKTNADSGTVRGVFGLPADYIFAGKLATLNIGGAEVSFALDSKGNGVTGKNKFSKPSYNTKTGLWTLKGTLKNGSWQLPWADYGITNANISKPGVLVSGLPVILLVDTEAFVGTTNLQYTATQGKSGSAK